MTAKVNWMRLWILLTTLTLLVGLVGGLGTANALEREERQRGVLGSVQLIGFDESGDNAWGCSGTVIDPRGYVLTAFHCVGASVLDVDPSTGQTVDGLALGTLYHPDGVMLVAPTIDAKKAPIPAYWALYQNGAPELDIAVLKLVATFDPDEEQPGELPEDLPLVVVPLGDSDAIELGDPITIIGYPGAGGFGILVTYTEGSVSGFFDIDEAEPPEFLKTDAEAGQGNSGGLVMNDAGEQVGVVSFGPSPDADPTSQLVFAPMSNFALPYIEAAIEGKPVENASGNPVVTEGPFGFITFDTSDSGQPAESDDPPVFPEGTNQVFASFDYQNLSDGTEWGYAWLVDGEQVLGDQGLEWDLGESGRTGVSIAHDNGLPIGVYELRLFVEGQEVRHGAFSVGDQTDPGQVQSEGVVLSGMVIDADTEQPIPNAYVLLFQPGTSLEDVQNATEEEFDQMLVAGGITDEEGLYITAPGLERGQTYSAAILAEGYQFRFFEDALEILEDDPDLIEMEPVALKSQ
jgi:serine protease Do